MDDDLLGVSLDLVCHTPEHSWNLGCDMAWDLTGKACAPVSFKDNHHAADGVG